MNIWLDSLPCLFFSLLINKDDVICFSAGQEIVVFSLFVDFN